MTAQWKAKVVDGETQQDEPRVCLADVLGDLGEFVFVEEDRDHDDHQRDRDREDRLGLTKPPNQRHLLARRDLDRHIRIDERVGLLAQRLADRVEVVFRPVRHRESLTGPGARRRPFPRVDWMILASGVQALT